ncbi:MAG: cysteine desulfurase [Nanoarchaeota archaeon]|nr:cysteine desulfurase [Nanoarchaeota archaeon]MBU1004331.1 cysteine desulfurase [Nanoarchaeota archaeon]MBU1945451.1 cysteine desulfurase [Nanoarchaeota archaeon]
MKLSNDSGEGLENSKNFQKIYLDNSATTMVDKEVAKAMQPYFTKIYGNASSLHQFGQEAKRALEQSREIIAKSINADPKEIIFTSGGTESDNLAIKGIAYANKEKGNHIITTKIEHHAVEHTCKSLEKEGFKITYLDVDKEGFINPDQLKKEITDKTILVTIIHGNNEIGAIQDIEPIGTICKEHNIPLHIDAVQSFTKTEIDVKKQNITLSSFSAHKLHGPKGIGALYIKKGTKLNKLIEGGAHEFNLRPGTENIPGIVGFAKAVEIAKQEDCKKIAELRDYFIEKVLKEIPETKLNGPTKDRLCNNINITFKFIEGEALLIKLDDKGIAVSTGSACSSKDLRPSHVLTAIGLHPAVAHGSIRFTLSKYTTKEELDYTLTHLKKAVKELRELSPLWGQSEEELTKAAYEDDHEHEGE